MPIAAGALATGIIFNSNNLAVARNPEVSEAVFTISLIGFALVETFTFVSLMVAFIAHVFIQ